eukprot:gnl/MRDRNA2_/MRDRNA2_100324_c0_seq1.p1 gnl/MRDRNA2_/MRDRNA2_100324_c0~~gnl/MRDRNA2_/MRDRNA2_100324_c0_seq1.p1  ORF type:complete len:324 (+),score=51.78 gnl/MRDRNA2_/MRDRNA2_100324_c0_seq1:124-1095(+)
MPYYTLTGEKKPSVHDCHFDLGLVQRRAPTSIEAFHGKAADPGVLSTLEEVFDAPRDQLNAFVRTRTPNQLRRLQNQMSAVKSNSAQGSQSARVAHGHQKADDPKTLLAFTERNRWKSTTAEAHRGFGSIGQQTLGIASAGAADLVRPPYRQQIEAMQLESPDAARQWSDSLRGLRWVTQQFSGPHTTSSELDGKGDLHPNPRHAANRCQPIARSERSRRIDALKEDDAALDVMQQRLPGVPQYNGYDGTDRIDAQLVVPAIPTRDPLSPHLSAQACQQHNPSMPKRTSSEAVHQPHVLSHIARSKYNPKVESSFERVVGRVW